ncbi:precorrin-4 C(11)-methyltransferase [Thermincola potens]|uniref:Precorrin-4 C11-methyltransferase n=1 Tax=Thermincola potens (strain JR) TaxID=635013 RepID=D5XFJ8_THEPJ|nr:precorrin-4 C(11)-methyltransferase [Thermincola potens]ADG82419.1 precorrin-4 C11-methyltransferase [Thermincola potens JR]
MKVYFIGAGPGDPELITVKGAKAIESADVIIYAGSLVNKEILKYARPEAKIYNSAHMNLDEVLAVMKEGFSEGKIIARVHTGDPSIYGAIQEQMDALKNMNIPYEVIPGVSSFVAAAASLKQEYTLPDVTQTVILTRLEGRTEVPEKERLRKLARYRATMCIFLSVHAIEEVAEELKEGYPPDTPVVVIQKASWPDERIVRGTLDDIAGKVREANITKTALIIVGDVFRGQYALSKLYDKNFSHGYREGQS